MWDLNPQAHKFHLQDVDRQFAAANRGRSADGSRRQPRFAAIFNRLSEGSAHGAVAIIAVFAVAGLLLV